ncbi:hypothetical protein ACFX13_032487 [Malus domestica]
MFIHFIVAKAAKEEEPKDNDEMDGFQTDDDDEYGMDLTRKWDLMPRMVMKLIALNFKTMQASDPLRVHSLMQTLDFQHQALANGVAQHAEQRRAEIEKEKMEKAAAATAS